LHITRIISRLKGNKFCSSLRLFSPLYGNQHCQRDSSSEVNESVRFGQVLCNLGVIIFIHFLGLFSARRHLIWHFLTIGVREKITFLQSRLCHIAMLFFS